MEKHNLYFKVLEGFSTKECPLCNYVTTLIENYYDNILYEGVNDFGFIKKFRKNRGFCNFHAHKLLSYKRTSEIASVYFYLYRDLVNNLEEEKVFSLNENNCQVCEFVSSIEFDYLHTFINFIEKEHEFKKEFLASDGFCLPHFNDLVNLYKKFRLKASESIIDFHLKKYNEIYKNIERYLDFKNVSSRTRTELSYEEQLIYQKAIKVFSGYEGKKKLI